MRGSVSEITCYKKQQLLAAQRSCAKKGTFPCVFKIMFWNPLKVCLQNLFVLFYTDRRLCKSRSQGYLETVAVILALFLNLKYFAEFCPSVPPSPHPAPPCFTVNQCLKNSSRYFIYVTTGNMSSCLEWKLMLLLVCTELVVECSGPVAGSLEVFSFLQRVC